MTTASREQSRSAAALIAAPAGDAEAAVEATRSNWASLAEQIEQSMSNDREEEGT
jgi:hypothetical protein